MAKKQKPEKKELINLDEAATIESPFQFEQLAIKKNEGWRIKLTIKTRLPNVFNDYGIAFVYDDTADLAEIADLEKRLAEIEDDAQLFEDEKAKDVSSLKKQIASANEEMDKRREKYGEVEGHASVLSMKYKLGDTVVEFIIDRDCVDELAAKMMGHGSLGHYKVSLTRN